jgi:hypothetical protein
MQHVVEGVRRAWETGPGALIGFVVGAVVGAIIWGTSHVDAHGMFTAPIEDSVLSILIGGAIAGVVFHMIVEAVRRKDNWS